MGSAVSATATDPNGNTSEFSASTPALDDVTADLSVMAGGLVYNRTTREFVQTLTVTNIGTSAIARPIDLAFLYLTGGTLVNPSGTIGGNPYLTILASGSLGVGGSLTVTVAFSDPTLSAIYYARQFLTAGASGTHN